MGLGVLCPFGAAKDWTPEEHAAETMWVHYSGRKD